MSEIPKKAREAVVFRDAQRCARCGAFGATDIHHRKRRREGGHPLSNLVLLCRDDHQKVHAHPERSRSEGFIVSVWDSPLDIPMKTWRGLVSPDDEGQLTFVTTNKKEEGI